MENIEDEQLDKIPQHLSMKSSARYGNSSWVPRDKYYGGYDSPKWHQMSVKINRYLKSNIGKPYNEVYSEFKKKFPKDYCGVNLNKHFKFRFVEYDELDFLKQLATNTVCPNKIKVWDKKAHAYKEEKCGAKLWTALNRDDIGHGWIKLGEAGWIREEFITQETEKLMAKEKLDKKETTLFNKLFDQYEFYQENGYYNITYKGPKKYPVAQYIYERMNVLFDYLILDEMQLNQDWFRQVSGPVMIHQGLG